MPCRRRDVVVCQPYGCGNTGSSFVSTYVVQLKTPDTLNLGYVSPAANLPSDGGQRSVRQHRTDGGGKRYQRAGHGGAGVGHEGRSVTYELRMEPWLKLATHTSDYKAFQNKTVVGYSG